jgi:hypothetical protein
MNISEETGMDWPNPRIGKNEVQTVKIADEFKFVDKDIADAFRNTNAFIGTALMTQLSRDVRELTKALRDFKAELDDPT